MTIFKFTLSMLLGALIALLCIFIVHTIAMQDKITNNIQQINTALNLSTIN